MTQQTTQPQESIASLVRKCVHCGFCNATCPSYQELGNELDGPRGRIYQIANLARGESDDPSIRRHLDSCLNCRNCETTCPSGVEYHKIFTQGKALAVEKYPYGLSTRLRQMTIVRLLSKPAVCRVVFGIAARLRFLAPVLPAAWRQLLPQQEKQLPLIDNSHCDKTAILIQGCVQSGAQPNTNRALHNLCARLGIRLIALSGCCAALPHHLNDKQRAIAMAKANIDACLPYLDEGAVGIVMSASACTLELQEYCQLLADDDDYHHKAARFSAQVQEPSQLLNALSELQLDAQQANLSFHPPCTLQHGQQKADAVEQHLRQAGFALQSIAQKHLCCGSAGTYSLFQPKVAKSLRQQKINHLTHSQPTYLATANIGCQMFLQQVAKQRVWHWLELLEQLANQKDARYPHH